MEKIFIDEKTYQKIKKEMGKKNDVFTTKEYGKLTKRRGEI